jgi:large repetitive protein
MIAAALGATASPASAKTYPPPSIHLLCTAAANSGTLEGSVCALPFGVTTAPNNYSATIAVSKVGSVGPTVTFALTAGSLPPGLSLSPSSGSSGSITGNPTKAGVYNFTIKATDGGKTSTLAYEITITVQGAPDQLLCDPADNGGFLISGSCVLPDAVIGLPYQGHLLTSHKAGGALSVVSGSLPPGLSCRLPSLAPATPSAAPPPTQASNPAATSPCRAPATRVSPCTRRTRST